jgi:serine/threonine protein kinase
MLSASQATSETKILGIFRGSFNPPHLGHHEVIQHCLSQKFSEIYILANEENPFKTDRLEYAARKKMLEIQFKDFPQVKIVDIDSKSLIKGLREKNHSATIVGVAGSDRALSERKPSDSPVDEWLIILRDTDRNASLHTQMNGKPVKVANPEEFKQQGFSATFIRDFLSSHDAFYETQSNISATSLPAQLTVLQHIKDQMLYRDQIAVIQRFLQVNRQKLPQDIHITSISNQTNIMGGLSGDSIYVVKNTSGKTIFIVKQFKGNNRFLNVTSEVQAMKKINELNLKFCSSIHNFFATESDTDTFLAMEVVKGKTLKGYMDIYKEHLDNLTHRNNLHLAIQLYAKALAELNSTGLQHIKHISEDEVKSFTKKMCEIRDSLTRNCAHYPSLNIDLVKSHINSVINNFIKNPGHYGYTHGDTNPSNFFIDLETQKVTMIDTGYCASKWMTPEGNPKGFPANEFLEAASCIPLIGRRLEFPENINAELETIFKKSYLENISNLAMSQEAQNFFRLFWMLRSINTPLREIENYGGRREYAVKPGLFEQMITELKTEIGQMADMQEFGLKLKSGGLGLGLFRAALNNLGSTESVAELPRNSR